MSLIRLLDINGHFYPIWRVKEAKNAPIGEAARETVQTLREFAARGGADHVVACCDSGRTFRHAIGDEWKATDPGFRGYKSNRGEKDAAMMAALDRVIDELEQDGVPILRVPGFEADDVIATVVRWAVAEGHEVECSTEDKDIMALVGPGVRVVRRDGSTVGPEEVEAKFGVTPARLSEYLAIVGDTSDHVPGVLGMGKVAAVGLINKHGGYLAALDKARAEEERLRTAGPDDNYAPEFTAKQRAALVAGESAFRMSLRLTTLRDDVPLDFAAVTAPRVPKPKDTGFQVDGYEEEEDDMTSSEQTIAATPQQTTHTETAAPSSNVPSVTAEVVEPPQHVAAPVSTAAPMVISGGVPVARPTDLAVREIQQVTEQALARPAGAYSLSLDPRDFKEARMLAKDVSDAKIFTKIQSPQQALALILTGREYGLPAMASMRLIHIIEGQPAIHAQVKIGLAMKSPRVEYMEIVEWKDEGENSYCVWRGKRRGRPTEDTCKYGVNHAKQQQLVKPNSNWVKMPGWMSMVRAGANLATILIPDEMAGLYTFDEMGAAEPMVSGDTYAATRAA